MNPTQLLENFDRISEAPDAIPRLRRFILDLAVRGKLVEQDPNDEPAAELIKRIQAEKQKLGLTPRRKDAKKSEKTGETLGDLATWCEIAFEIPSRWQWIRLVELTSYIQRGKSPVYAIDDGFPVISQKCVQWRGLDLSVARLVTLESIEKYEEVRFLRDGDLLWNSTGTGTIGRVIKLNYPPEKLVCDSHVTVVRCIEVDPEYILIWLR
jgi:type I restriction enzyme S subunit